MFQITSETISEEVINKYIPQEITLRDKLIRKINEYYQYNFEAYNEAQEGNYSFIERLLESHLFHYC
jgi:hypothetical protein